MTDEEINRKFDTVANHLAALAVGQQHLQEAQQHLQEAQAAAESRTGRLERIVALALRAGARERRELRRSIGQLTEAVTRLAESQAHTDQRLDALIDIVREGRNGKG